jgi:murein L,D-transpeptidase YafK
MMPDGAKPMPRSFVRRLPIALITAATSLAASITPASALSIELKDVAADRIERQRSAAAGALPLPGTPNVAILDDRLKKNRVALQAPMLIRIFKSESELEIWKLRDGAFVLFATYPICHWSGSVGPKLRQGDKQAPEGFYTLTRQQIRHVGRWPKSLDLGFPNVFDQSLARTGSLILIHGGCSSVGCFAMTNPVMDEIHLLASAAIESGQEHVPVQVFPFRMTDKAMVAQSKSPWIEYWKNLKEGYDAFEKTKRSPMVSVCDGRYSFADSLAGGFGPLQACGSTLTAIREQNQWLRDVPEPVSSPLRPGRQSSVRPSRIRCDLDRPSCRKHVALMSRSPGKRKAYVLANARRVEARVSRGG